MFIPQHVNDFKKRNPDDIWIEFECLLPRRRPAPLSACDFKNINSKFVIHLTPGGVSFPMSSPFFLIYLCLHEIF
jgi:hypothetical protein